MIWIIAGSPQLGPAALTAAAGAGGRAGPGDRREAPGIRLSPRRTVKARPCPAASPELRPSTTCSPDHNLAEPANSGYSRWRAKCSRPGEVNAIDYPALPAHMVPVTASG